MLEIKMKTITRWGLTIDGCDVFFPTKRTAINIGKIALRTNPGTKMFEEYRLWGISCKKSRLIDEQRFDRTFLIQDQIG